MSEAPELIRKKKTKQIKNKTKTLKHLRASLKSLLPVGSFNTALPLFSFASSCVVFNIFSNFIYAWKYQSKVREILYLTFSMYNYAYIAIAAGCSFQIFRGFTFYNLSQFLFWITLKFIECGMVIGTVLYRSSIIKVGGPYANAEPESETPELNILEYVMLAVTILEILLAGWKIRSIYKELRPSKVVDKEYDDSSDSDTSRTISLKDD